MMDKMTYQKLDRIEDSTCSVRIMLDYVCRMLEKRYPDTHKEVLEDIKKVMEGKK